MAGHPVFWEEVDLKYQLFDGLFLNLPFEDVRRAGILLPVFTDHVRQRLAAGDDPEQIVTAFFEDQLVDFSPSDQIAMLFRFLQIVERQIVLFDALEDAAFPLVNDMEGSGTLNETLARIAQAERRARLSEVAETFRVRIVLTAHPTQFYPSRVLGIITDLAHGIGENDIPGIHDILLQLGKTRFSNRHKPTPMDEAQSLLWYLENVFYDVFPDVHARVAVAARANRRDALLLPPQVELGFWPGGDRDGNPFVTAETTASVAHLLRRTLLRRYQADVEQLARRLTFDGAIERVTAIQQRLAATLQVECRDFDLPAYDSAEQLQHDVLNLWDFLHAEHEGLFVTHVEALLWRIAVFGFHFATLDVRQDSRIHGRALDLMPELSLPANVAERFTTLERYLGDDSATLPAVNAVRGVLSDDPVLLDTVDSLRTAREIQLLGGHHAVHRYIISNTRSSANILEVLTLARIAGYAPDQATLDIVPLFETVPDLEESVSIMEQLYRSPVYRSHLRHQGDVQQIMLGFSDGTKDGGYVTANWKIFRAREELTELAARYGIRVVFFEGRGGPPARGGGKTHQFYRGMSRRTARDQIHLTIQGQTVSSNFGNRSSARYNLEQLVTAGLENLLLGEDQQDFTPEGVSLIDTLSSISYKTYQALKQRDDFVPYLERMTPLTFYGAANNASRPTSRGSGGSLRFEDLRAIPFVGAWSQMKQNVPGFYGFGTALSTIVNDGKLDVLRDLFQRHLFFRTLVENSMQSLSKANFALTHHIGRDSRFGEIWRVIRDEAELTRAMLMKVAETDQLLAHDEAIRSSIRMREEIILPVLLTQQYALMQLRNETDLSASEREAHRKLVVKSMATIVNAGRNSV